MGFSYCRVRMYVTRVPLPAGEDAVMCFQDNSNEFRKKGSGPEKNRDIEMGSGESHVDPKVGKKVKAVGRKQFNRR